MEFCPQICFDENGCLNAQNVVSSDDFFVDELLDLSNEEEFVEEEEETAIVSGQELEETAIVSGQKASFSDDFPSLPTSELSVPADDIADLEWLSHFVEDSFSQFPTIISPPNPKKPAINMPINHKSPFTPPVPVKPRTKRTRITPRVWRLDSPPLTESPSSSPSSSSSFSPPPEHKKLKTKNSPENRGFHAPPRRCTHCGVQKTPQWRTGPLGPKTLCNACGVRFKSGRLLPEYRPACSPSFSSELHSNHHRKVLEMRRRKEIPGLVLPAVPSF